MRFVGKIVSADFVNVVVDDNGCLTPFSVGSDHCSYPQILDAVDADDADAFVALANPVKVFENLSEDVVIDGEEVKYRGLTLTNTVCSKILDLHRNNKCTKSVVKFLEKCLANPGAQVSSTQQNSINQLFRFLEAHGLPLCEDGDFLAYKSVNRDYTDCWTGTIDNSVGADIPRRERWDVCDDPNIGCSRGYHAGALEYAGPGGYYNRRGQRRVVIVKINPADVVSVPHDAHSRKVRVVWYQVVGEYKHDLLNDTYTGEVDEDYTPTPEDVAVSHDHVFAGNTYKFMYTKDNGEQSVRWLDVDSVEDGLVTGMLIHPSPNAGEYRAFRLDRMSGLEELIL